MRLGYIKFSGYKRFKDESTLSLNSKMVALIGPNEAGKTSTLKLLKHISNDTAFSIDENYKYDDEVTPKLLACFFLEQEDYKEIDSSVPKKFFIEKSITGERDFRIEPSLKRDKSLRKKILLDIKKCLSNEKLRTHLVGLSVDHFEFLESIEGVDLNEETIGKNDLDLFSALGDYISSAEDLPKYVIALEPKILAFLEHEKAIHPNDKALEICESLLPTVIEFTSKDRKLDTSYNMMGYKHAAQQNRTVPCNALINLASIAHLDLDELKKNIDNKLSDRIRTQFSNANERLKEAFSNTWSQAELNIYLHWEKPEIEIMVEEFDSKKKEYIKVDMRSDGFRQYIALFAFTMKENIRKPILLIDEAELHLHYDAQADLIQTLTQKDLASKIIYTTHSAGCLPEDLGNGVKLVIPDKNDGTFSTSRIENKFWNSENLGFSPILYGMGANTLAFFPTRKAVIVEGQSDPLLIPTIFRQVGKLDYNSFQIVPGMANLSANKFPLLALQGQRVVYLVDNDAAGEGYIDDLKGTGVSEKLIFKISSTEDSIITVEDWIDDSVYSNAVETYRERFFNSKATFPDGYFNGDGKADKLKEYEKLINQKISKVDLAYIILEVVEQNPMTPIFKKEYKKAIVALKKKISSSLKK